MILCMFNHFYAIWIKTIYCKKGQHFLSCVSVSVSCLNSICLCKMKFDIHPCCSVNWRLKKLLPLIRCLPLSSVTCTHIASFNPCVTSLYKFESVSITLFIKVESFRVLNTASHMTHISIQNVFVTFEKFIIWHVLDTAQPVFFLKKKKHFYWFFPRHGE